MILKYEKCALCLTVLNVEHDSICAVFCSSAGPRHQIVLLKKANELGISTYPNDLGILEQRKIDRKSQSYMHLNCLRILNKCYISLQSPSTSAALPSPRILFELGTWLQNINTVCFENAVDRIAQHNCGDCLLSLIDLDRLWNAFGIAPIMMLVKRLPLELQREIFWLVEPGPLLSALHIVSKVLALAENHLKYSQDLHPFSAAAFMTDRDVAKLQCGGSHNENCCAQMLSDETSKKIRTLRQQCLKEILAKKAKRHKSKRFTKDDSEPNSKVRLKSCRKREDKPHYGPMDLITGNAIDNMA